MFPTSSFAIAYSPALMGKTRILSMQADEVTVTVASSVATLTGTVDSWSEWRAATENTGEGSAIRVMNKLEVEYLSRGIALGRHAPWASRDGGL